MSPQKQPEEIFEYNVTIRKVEKTLCFWTATEGGISVSGQAMSVSQAMMAAADAVFNGLQNQGRIK